MTNRFYNIIPQQLSQFWYSDDTKIALANICQTLATNNEDFKIGLLSSPSLYSSVKSIHKNVKIFEFDERFSAYADDFVHYDYNKADGDYLQPFHGYFDLIIVDPPFLSEECIEKMSIIVKNLRKSNGKVILCSGETVEQWATKYMELTRGQFEPKHNRNLGNEFASYSNFNLDEILKNI